MEENLQERTMLLKIGEFARVGQVSVAALRHYDHCGLLKPNVLDPETGYRYYRLDQLPRLNRILALKELGFPLEQIAWLLEGALSLEQLQGMFRLKQAQTEQLIEAEQARLLHLAARLRQLEQEGKMPAYEVLLKQVEPLLVASIRETVLVGNELERHLRALAVYVDQERGVSVPPSLRLVHARSEQRDDGVYLDVETAMPLKAPLAGNEQIVVRTLPGGLMACTVHTGQDLMLGQAYVALYAWIKEHDYQISGPPRHIHLRRGEQLTPREYVTELQFSIARPGT